MPTYEYKCSHCGHTLEEFQSMSAAPLRTCPNCKKDTLKRGLGGGAGMIFKGQGFYKTDYGKGGDTPKRDGKNSKSAPAGDAAKSGTAKKDATETPQSPPQPPPDKKS